MKFFGKKQKKAEEPILKLPRHIAVIMDGNGRWAKARGLPRAAGHAAGAETFRRIANYCREIGAPYFTVYAFSTENWKRPKDEVDALMSLLERYLEEAAETMERDGVRMRFLGDTSVLRPELQGLIEKVDEISSRYDGPLACICLNYGGRSEILNAAKRIARDYAGREDEITEEVIAQNLYSSGLPDPDLLIRPGGEYRLSNFLLWQSAYSELYFTDKLWPDFKEADIDEAVREYNRRSRRFGDVTR